MATGMLVAERPPRIAFERLVAATKQFSRSYFLGSGATGEVFCGELDGGPIAVKRLKLPPGATPEARVELARRFHAELGVLGAYRHSRLVRLLSFAVDESPGSTHPFALVFELLEGGALSDWLRSPGGAQATRPRAGDVAFSALARVDAALGVAAGLSFLHGMREPGEDAAAPAAVVLHRDVKSANIGFALVNGNLYSKLLDCGLAKALNGGAEGGAGAGGVQSTVTIVGTPGYVAPELANKGASVATEVYAFGVVLLELLTGVQVGRTTAMDVVEAAEDGGGVGTLITRADARVWSDAAASSLATLTLECLHPRAPKRPSCAVILERLRALRTLIAPTTSPLAQCMVCLDEIPESLGVFCGGGGRHFVCCADLQTHVRTKVEDTKSLRKCAGRIPCIAAGGGADGCGALLTVQMLSEQLDKATHLTFETALLYLLFDAPAQKAEREAARKRAEQLAREKDVALEERVRRLRAVIVERDLTLHCPRCDAAFLDYSNCNALHCRDNCGAAFCGLCLTDCGQNAHPHYYSVHKGTNIFDGDLFQKTHRDARRAKIVAAVRALAGEVPVQRALVAALGKADLQPLGISVADVLRDAGVGEEATPVPHLDAHLSSAAAAAAAPAAACFRGLGAALDGIRDLLHDAIEVGVPAFNSGDAVKCAREYIRALTAVKAALAPFARSRTASAEPVRAAAAAVVAAIPAAQAADGASESAWTARHAIDAVLSSLSKGPLAAARARACDCTACTHAGAAADAACFRGLGAALDGIRDLLHDAIEVGVPAFNSGDAVKCAREYIRALTAVKAALAPFARPRTASAEPVRAAAAAVAAAIPAAQAADGASESAWTARHAIDAVLSSLSKGPLAAARARACDCAACA